MNTTEVITKFDDKDLEFYERVLKPDGVPIEDFIAAYDMVMDSMKEKEIDVIDLTVEDNVTQVKDNVTQVKDKVEKVEDEDSIDFKVTERKKQKRRSKSYKARNHKRKILYLLKKYGFDNQRVTL
ncbi:uncharacterized protein LOC136088514 [Hydra vulgaris]|uniref:Uncharacterized protein LOC136088514 n=1 Tax=Hydra vulgaris TaxID=6087 RepID=A0ABM4D2F0_HYDVU